MSVSTDAADAIVSVLNTAQDAGDFDMDFRAIRVYVPRFAIEEVEPKGLQVCVVPTSHGSVNLTRGSDKQLPVVSIVVVQKLKSVDNEQIDPLVALVEGIKGLVGGTLAVGTYRAMCNLEIEPLYDPDAMLTKRTFWSKTTVSFEVLQ